MAISDFPIIDWSPIGKLPDVYEKGAERAREAAFREQLAGGLPMRNGVVDWNAAAQIAARAGNMGGISQFAQLANAQQQAARAAAAHAETARHNRAVEAAYGKPTIQMDPTDPRDPTAPRTGTIIQYDKFGNVTTRPLAPQQRPQVTEPQQAPATPDIWSNPGGAGAIPGPAPPAVGPGAALDAAGGPQMAQAPPVEPSLTERLLAENQQPLPPRGPQFAQAGGPATLPPQPPPATPAPPARMAQPDWLAGAAAPVMGQKPAEQPNPLAPEQRGELRYTTPLGPFNEDAIARYPRGYQDKVRALATGRMNIKSTSITGGERAALSNDVLAYFPGWSENVFSNRARALHAMGPGVEGRVTRAVNNLTDHLETAEKLMLALNNKDVPAYNAAVNAWRKITGYQADLPGSVQAAAPIIAGEMMKVIAGQGAGGVNERLETAINTMSTSTNPKTALAVLGTVKQLMGGQLKGLEQWYENNTYNTDFRKSRISGGARRIMEELENAHAAPAGGGGGGGRGYRVIGVQP